MAEFAVKCGITYDEFSKDAYELYEIFKKVDETEPFHYQEFVKARDEYFNGISHKSTRDWIERSTGIHMKPPAKRNGRSRHDHITRSNRLRKFKQDEYDEKYGGGRPDKKSIVKQWQLEHPGGKKADCIRDTGLTKPTVYKWWDAV